MEYKIVKALGVPQHFAIWGKTSDIKLPCDTTHHGVFDTREQAELELRRLQSDV